MPPPRGPVNPRKKFAVKPGFSMLVIRIGVGGENELKWVTFRPGRLFCVLSHRFFSPILSLLCREETFEENNCTTSERETENLNFRSESGTRLHKKV